MNFYVYELIDPNTNKVFYVGKGYKKRCYIHKSLSIRKKHYNKHLENKILLILNDNKEIITNIVFESEDEDITYLKEEELIKYYGIENLCNIDIGGKHGHYGYKQSEETKKLISQKNIERFKNPEERNKIREGTIKRFQDPKEREKISILTKNGMTKEVREKISTAKKGKPSVLNHQIECVCLNCGKIRKRSPSHAKIKKFCSKLCADKYKTHNIKTNCITCGKEIKNTKLRHKTYCTHSCYIKDKIKNNIQVICPTCGKINLRSKSRIKRIFCNKICQKEYKKL